MENQQYTDKEKQRRTISKIEEQRGLQFIRKFVVPSAVRHWNKAIELSRLKNKERYVLSPNDVSKVLIKKHHYIHNPGDLTRRDWIHYDAVPSNSLIQKPFQFSLTKDRGIGDLYVSAALPGSDNWINYYIDDPKYDISHLAVKPIKRTQLKEVDKDGDGREIEMPTGCQMTRADEGEAIQYLKRVTIPYLVTFWNRKFSGSKPTITAEEIIQNLRKVKQGKETRRALSMRGDQSEMIRIPYEYVVYDSISKTYADRSVRFTIEKGIDGSTLLIIRMQGITSIPKEPIIRPPMLFENSFTEPPDETGFPAITKKEEMEALQYIRRYILPMAVKAHNGVSRSFRQISEEEVQKNLRLSGRYPSYKDENPSLAFTSVPRGLYFSFMVHKQLQDFPDKGKLYVRFRTPDAMSPHEYYVGTPPLPLYEGIKVVHAAAPRVISKIEENQALQYIRNVLIPAAFRCYNDHVMGEFRIKHEDDLRKSIRKIDVEYTPRDFYETIYYEALVSTIGGKRMQKFLFYTRKPNHPTQLNRVRVGVSIEGYVAQEFYIGDPVYLT